MSYSLDEYARMLVDPVRGTAYLAAVRQSVRPGAVVADIGAGPGLLGVYAGTLGARRVYLIDPDASVFAGTALAENNGVGDRIEVICAASTDTVLPEPADVIISDLRGVTPFHGKHLAAAADMRQRLLAPGGICIPRRDTVMTALVEDHALYARTVHAWSALSVPLAHDSLTALLANRWYRTRANERQVLCEPSSFVTLDYALPVPALSRRWEMRATRDGTAHGLLLWFDAELTSTIAFSNSPFAPSALYGQAFFPFAPALTVRRGAPLIVELRGVMSGDDYEWSWTAADDSGNAVRHSTLYGVPMDPSALTRRAEQFTPERSHDSEILLELLHCADGQATLGSLASTLTERFPHRFPTPDSALHYVAQSEYLWKR